MVFGAFSAFRISCGGGGGWDPGSPLRVQGFRAVLCNKAMWA